MARLFGDLTVVEGLNVLEHLQESDSHVGRFGQCKLLAQADSWTTVEGKESPSNLLNAILAPSLRPPLHHVLTVHQLHSVGSEDGIRDGLALSDENRLVLVGTTATRKRSVLSGHTEVLWHRWVESESLVNDPFQVLKLFQGLKGYLRQVDVVALAEGVDNFRTQLGKNVGVSGKLEEAERQQTGGGVSGSQQDVQTLVTQDLGVSGLFGQLVQKDVAGGAEFLHLLGARVQGLVDVVVGKLVDNLVVAPEARVVNNPVEFLETGSHEQVRLGDVERLGKLSFHGRPAFGHAGLVLLQGLTGLTKQKLCARVDGQLEEERLDVELLAVVGTDEPCKSLDVGFQGLDVAHLFSGELRSQHGSGVFPAHAVQGEDSVAEQNLELAVAKAKHKVVELGAQNSLDVLRVSGRHHRGAGHGQMDGVVAGVPEALEQVVGHLAAGLFFHDGSHELESVPAVSHHWSKRGIGPPVGNVVRKNVEEAVGNQGEKHSSPPRDLFREVSDYQHVGG